MAELFNTQQVYKTMKIVLSIFHTHKIYYWFLGSIIPTALNNKLFRNVNDLDIIILSEHFHHIEADLEKVGYTHITCFFA